MVGLALSIVIQKGKKPLSLVLQDIVQYITAKMPSCNFSPICFSINQTLFSGIFIFSMRTIFMTAKVFVQIFYLTIVIRPISISIVLIICFSLTLLCARGRVEFMHPLSKFRNCANFCLVIRFFIYHWFLSQLNYATFETCLTTKATFYFNKLGKQ